MPGKAGDAGWGLGDGDAPLRSFRDLRVWRFALTSQLRRAVVSIPSNIAEGHRRESTKDYLNFLSMANASLAEVETELEIAARLGYVGTDDLAKLVEVITSIARQLYALRNALKVRV